MQPSLKGKADSEIANVANRDGRMIVALDNDYKDLAVKAGVIQLNAGRLNEDCLFKIFREFWRSGHRGKAKNRRTYLTNDGIRIKNGEEFLHRWHPHPCSHSTPHR